MGRRAASFLPRPTGVIAYGHSRRLDRGPQARVERPTLYEKQLIVETRSLRFALRAPVETTGMAIYDSPPPSYGGGRQTRLLRFQIKNHGEARRVSLPCERSSRPAAATHRPSSIVRSARRTSRQVEGR